MTATLAPASAAELAELLRARSCAAVRVLGGGSRQARLPAPPPHATTVSLARLCRVDRCEADDLTCSVEPGLPRAELDALLWPLGLELPCAGAGTLGGLFAADPIGASTPGGGSPRSLLLGLEGVLADGTTFKTGARVVKSVAGFDVHKLFVGSRGRLFAATLLHLKLRPRPRDRADFACGGLDAAAALRLFAQLRHLPLPPSRLQLQRDGSGFTVCGQLVGRGSFVGASMRRLGLQAAAAAATDHLTAADDLEVVAGLLLPSRLPGLLQALPADAPLLLRGGGRFETVLPPVAADALLLALPPLFGHGEITAGAPARRGRSTPLDAGAARLGDGLRRALDPGGVLV
ncbi:MAG TPA: FAD-binding oxidoreductase, partial [Planctomycetota bacterium]|nr:FAD-binding oxidoreductase [Planctomycetota bacterium]